jgi:hypothetical protein
MKKLFALLALLAVSLSAHAGMVWIAVALPTEQLEQARNDPKAIEKLLFEAKGENSVDLDKAWHGIHYLLNGTPWKVTSTAGEAILGGREFGTDLGYGPPHFLTPAQVKAIAEALLKETPAILTSRYRPESMETAGIYPKGIWKREGPQALQYLLDYYNPLVAFYKRAAENGYAVVIALT